MCIRDRVKGVYPEEAVVRTERGPFKYDYLIISLGAEQQPAALPGFSEGAFNAFNLEHMDDLRCRLPDFKKGRIVFFISGFPVICPTAPFEMVFLLDEYFRQRGDRDKVEISMVTPESSLQLLIGPGASSELGNMMAEQKINLIAGTEILALDYHAGRLCLDPVSYTHLDVYKRQALWSLAFSTLAIVLTAIVTVAILGPHKASRTLYPFFGMIRTVLLSKFLERVEIFAVATWGFGLFIELAIIIFCGARGPVSYTHLDVYKRQLMAIAGFSVPSFSLGISIRILRFIFVVIAAIFGLLGIQFVILLLIIHLVSLRSFGYPYMSPLAPLITRDLKDFVRVWWPAMRTRPQLLGEREPLRQPGGQESLPYKDQYIKKEDQD